MRLAIKPATAAALAVLLLLTGCSSGANHAPATAASRTGSVEAFAAAYCRQVTPAVDALGDVVLRVLTTDKGALPAADRTTLLQRLAKIGPAIDQAVTANVPTPANPVARTGLQDLRTSLAQTKELLPAAQRGLDRARTGIQARAAVKPLDTASDRAFRIYGRINNSNGRDWFLDNVDACSDLFASK